MNHHHGRIVLVEDNPSDVELILHGFQQVGIASYVKVLYDGDEALTYLIHTPEIRPPDLVILDLKLPKINGLEVLKQIRNNPSTKELPVAVFTSSSEMRDIQECRSSGVDLYLVKPVNHNDFKRALAQIIRFWSSHTRIKPEGASY